MALVIKGSIIWGPKCQNKSPVVYDGYVKYEETEIRRSAINQDFRDSEKKKKGPAGVHFGFFSVKFVMG